MKFPYGGHLFKQPRPCPIAPVLQLYDANEMAWSMFFRDTRTYWKWFVPTIINCICMPCKDITQLQGGIENADAFKVGSRWWVHPMRFSMRVQKWAQV